MISCNFLGGLGNNLFQLATAYGISKKYNFDLVLPRFVDRGNIWIYGQSTNLELSDLFENEFVYSDSISLPVYSHNDLNPNTSDYTFSEIPIKDNITYRGYFQSEKYFSGIDMSKEFILNKKNISYITQNYNDLFLKKTISLHYRLGGDRTTEHMQHYHKNVSIEYFKKALSLIEDYSPETHNILVFTDKIDLCEKLLSNLNYD
jgi:hypothetical protein